MADPKTEPKLTPEEMRIKELDAKITLPEKEAALRGALVTLVAAKKAAKVAEEENKVKIEAAQAAVNLAVENLLK